MFPELPEPLTCDWRDPESVEDLLEDLSDADPHLFGPLWDDERGTYDIEIYLLPPASRRVVHGGGMRFGPVGFP